MGGEGMVLESRNITEKVAEEGLDQGKSCTLLIQRGVLRINDWVVIGDQAVKIKKMGDDYNHSISEASLSTAVEVGGLQELPEAGTVFFKVDSEQEAKVIVSRIKKQ